VVCVGKLFVKTSFGGGVSDNNFRSTLGDLPIIQHRP
jgi:hypothetical protein